VSSQSHSIVGKKVESWSFTRSSVLFGRGFGTGSELLERVTTRAGHVPSHVKVDPHAEGDFLQHKDFFDVSYNSEREPN
jgi:hypothetical protein